MKKLLKKNQKICMVPQDVKGALSSTIKKTVKNIVQLEIKNDDLKFYKTGDVVEMFTVVEEGMLYFKPCVTEIDEKENLVTVEFDKKQFDLLQRREFTRVELEKEFTLKDTSTGKQKDFVCKCIDISAGGMKFLTDAELTPAQDYIIEFSLESNIPIEAFFKPIRSDASGQKGKNAKNIVSGRFIALKNIDKIAIVQYCFKKQIENTNK